MRQGIWKATALAAMLDEFDLLVLRHLDGRHDRPQLLAMLADEVREGRLVPREDGQPISDPEKLRGAVGYSLQQSLRKLAGLALLIG